MPAGLASATRDSGRRCPNCSTRAPARPPAAIAAASAGQRAAVPRFRRSHTRHAAGAGRGSPKPTARSVHHDVMRMLSCPPPTRRGLDRVLVGWRVRGALSPGCDRLQPARRADPGLPRDLVVRPRPRSRRPHRAGRARRLRGTCCARASRKPCGPAIGPRSTGGCNARPSSRTGCRRRKATSFRGCRWPGCWCRTSSPTPRPQQDMVEFLLARGADPSPASAVGREPIGDRLREELKSPLLALLEGPARPLPAERFAAAPKTTTVSE